MEVSEISDYFVVTLSFFFVTSVNIRQRLSMSAKEFSLLVMWVVLDRTIVL